MNFRPDALICSKHAPDVSEWCRPPVSSWRNPEQSVTLSSPSPLSLLHAVWSSSPVLLSAVQVTPLHCHHCFMNDAVNSPLLSSDLYLVQFNLLNFARFGFLSPNPIASLPCRSLPGVPLYPGGDGETFSQPDEGRAVVTGLGPARPLLGALERSHFVSSFRQQIVFSTDYGRVVF